ncbi:hypothetical protein P5E67_05055 [Vibrio parahaemolyticus]|nr:hypothetical protein [Vibrio parahaemolyticus]
MKKISLIMVMALATFNVMASEETDLISTYREMMNAGFEPNNLWDKEIHINLPYKVTMCMNEICIAGDYGFNFDDIYLKKTPKIYVGMNLMGEIMEYDGLYLNRITFKIK